MATRKGMEAWQRKLESKINQLRRLFNRTERITQPVRSNNLTLIIRHSRTFDQVYGRVTDHSLELMRLDDSEVASRARYRLVVKGGKQIGFGDYEEFVFAADEIHYIQLAENKLILKPRAETK